MSINTFSDDWDGDDEAFFEEDDRWYSEDEDDDQWEDYDNPDEDEDWDGSMDVEY